MKKQNDNTLEKILCSVKNAGESIKRNAKVYAIVGAAALSGYLMDKSVESAKGGEIKIMNNTTNLGVNVSNMFTKYLADANECKDSNDGTWAGAAQPSAPWLKVHSAPYGIELQKDARPKNTPETEFYLSVIGNLASSGSVNNTLKIKVTDSNGLEHRNVLAYDISNPNIKYNIPKNGTTVSIPLNSLTGKGPGIYATWKIETPAEVKGDIASTSGTGSLDGKVDIQDIKVACDEWLNETFEGQNYSWSDVNYDGITNFQDFAIMANGWIGNE